MQVVICNICNKDITQEEIYYFDKMFFCQKCYKKEKAERKALADEKRKGRKDNTDS